MKLRWSKDALRDLIDIRAYIREDAPSRADTLVRELIASAERLEEFPYSGRAVPEYDEHDRYREIIAGSYRIVYRVESSTVDVLTGVTSGYVQKITRRRWVGLRSRPNPHRRHLEADG